jgi:hypothetical protein
MTIYVSSFVIGGFATTWIIMFVIIMAALHSLKK